MKRFLYAVCILGLLAPQAWGREISIDAKGGKPNGVELTRDDVKNKAGAALRFEAHVSNLIATDVKTERGVFTLLSIPGFQHSGIIGAPALPVMNRIIEVPLGAKIEVSVDSATRKTLSLKELGITAPLMPRQPPQPKSGQAVPFAYEKRAYLAKGFAAEEPVSFEDLGILRDRRLVLLKIAPVAYDAAAGNLEIRNDIRVRVELPGADLAATAKLKATYGSPHFSFVSKNVLTPASLSALEGKNGCRPSVYLIISDRKFEKDLEPFIAWKTAKGFQVITAYTDTVGTTSDAIKSYVHGLYNNATAEQAAPDFVLFVGDNEQIPAFKGKSGGHITDLYFVAVTSGDILPDILTGRFSATSSDELVPQIEKTLEYEKYAFADPSFLQSAVLVAGWDYSHTVEWGWPQINYGAKYYFNAEHGMGASKGFLVSSSDQYETEIRSMVSNGANFVNYTAHGSETSWADPAFTIPQIGALKNKGKYPLVVGNCCLTSSFQVSTCFGEAWLRAKDKGAIGYIGGSNSTYWDEDLWWGNGHYPVVHPNPQGTPPKPEDTTAGAYDGVMGGTACSNAALNVAGNMAIESSNTSRKLYYWEVYHLFGDPSLMVYWGIPSDTNTQHPAELKKDVTTLEVQTAPKACVGVTKDGQLLGAACADSAGLCVVTLKPSETTGTANIVVTGQNCKPYTGTIAIIE
ncbi:MAG: hypothetical protein HY816_06620 [Candidatus Wallbacteria bacterium]|nr:hypothetical protein [Candidatus Wallbacteria bacterium]